MSNFPVSLPGPTRGLKIGVMGGSFDPPHSGHAHVIETARRRLGLDWVWVMPAKGNPLKMTQTPFLQRWIACRDVLFAPRVRVTSFEEDLGLRYTLDVLTALKRRGTGAKFVWIMGADNLEQFHLWRRWEEIARTVPIAVVSRPDAFPRAGLSKFAQRFGHARLGQHEARSLPYREAPAWALLKAPHDPASSTAIRARLGAS